MLLNKDINLVYGLFLEKLDKDDYDIWYYKTPSFIIPVEYDKILDKLFNSHISENEHEDIYFLKNNSLC